LKKKRGERERREERERGTSCPRLENQMCNVSCKKKKIYTLYNNANGKMIFTIKKDKKNYYDNYVCVILMQLSLKN
jgi:hypothetical protein